MEEDCMGSQSPQWTVVLDEGEEERKENSVT
jgi:hypothetical protein